MNWNNEKRTLGELIPYEKNPRVLTDKQRKDIEKSLKKFNLVEVPAINLDNKIIAGHQRIKILYELNGPDYEIDVRVPNRLLSEKEYKEYLIRSNANTGEWDWKVLDYDWDKDLLSDWGLEHIEQYNDVDLGDFFNTHTEKPIEKHKIVLEYIQEDYDKVINAFNSLIGTKEEIVFGLLKINGDYDLVNNKI